MEEILIYFIYYLLLSMLGESAEKIIAPTNETRILGCFIRLRSEVYCAYCWDQ